MFQSEIGLSLDVIYHLVEDEVFYKYMKDLFQCSRKYVIIYASNTDEQERFQAQHVRHRAFTKWVKKNAPNWQLIEYKENDFAKSNDPRKRSFASFYVYKYKTN